MESSSNEAFSQQQLRASAKLFFASFSTLGMRFRGVFVVTSLLSGLLPILRLIIIKLLIDSFLLSRSAFDSQVFLLLFLLTGFSFLANSLNGSYLNYLISKGGLLLGRHLYDNLHLTMSRLATTDVENPEKQKLLFRARNEITYRPQRLVQHASRAITAVSALIVVFGVMGFYHWALILLVVILTVPGIWFRFRHAETIYSKARNQSENEMYAAYFHRLITSDTYFHEVLTKRLFPFLRQKFDRYADLTAAQRNRVFHMRLKSELWLDSFVIVVLFGALYALIRISAFSQTGIGNFVLLFFCFQRGYEAVRTLASTTAAFYEDGLFLSDYAIFVSQSGYSPPKYTKYPSSVQCFSAENLCYAHKDGTPCLSGLNLMFKAGQIILIAGPNGSGKSTLLRLLAGVYAPTGGRITIDGIDIARFDRDVVNQNTGFLWQDSKTYNFTANENIALEFAPESPREAGVRTASEAMQIHDLFSGFSSKYQTMLGDLFPHSRRLSKGEWQKVALARLIYKAPPILLLDEPTSALDPTATHNLLQTLVILKQQRTVIVVSHDPVFLSIADYSYYLMGGKVVDEGRWSEIVSKKSFLHDFYQNQR